MLLHGNVRPGARSDTLDAHLPVYDIEDRHSIVVKAAPARVFGAMRRFSLFHSPVITALTSVRAWIMRSKRRENSLAGFVNEMQAFGWIVLDEIPGRRIILATVTRPWEADPSFVKLTREGWYAFAEPGYAKLVISIDVLPFDVDASVLRTTMRLAATDDAARRRLRMYWSLFAPGIRIVRAEGIRLIRAYAEHET